MNYLGYIIAAYSVFAIVLLWDLIAPMLSIRQAMREARQRAHREAAATSVDNAVELER